MNKSLLGIIIVIICISTAFSGCQDTNSVKTQKRPQNVYLDSTIVEFSNVTYNQDINVSGGIESTTVGWLFHNIAGRQISAKIHVKFYDKNNLPLYNETRYINNMPADYTEKSLQQANKVIYNGPNAAYVDHAVISVTET